MPQTTPLVTTVIPTYRRPKMLKRAIRSALNQTYPHLRVAVFDNASGDETGAVVAQMIREDPRITYHCHTENIGMVNNFNYAFHHVETPYFSILCDDDLLLPPFYETALAGFERHPDAVFSACASISMSATGVAAPGNLMPREGYYAPPTGLLEWRVAPHPTITANLFRREVIERFGVMKNIMCADYDLELRIVAQSPYVISFERGAIVINHENSATVQASLDSWWESYQTIQHSLDSLNTVTPNILTQVKANLHQDFAQQTYDVGLRSIVRHDIAGAQAAIAALRNYYQQELPAARMERMLNTQQMFWPVRLCLDTIYHVRKAINYQLKFRRTTEQYRHFVLNAER